MCNERGKKRKSMFAIKINKNFNGTPASLTKLYIYRKL